MLLMYCCSVSECGHVFVRTDERVEDVLNECPKCGNKTFFKCDFRTWTDNVNADMDELDDISWDLLTEEFKLLKKDADDTQGNLLSWKGRMIIYHNELWGLLKGNEPEKYSRNCPV